MTWHVIRLLSNALKADKANPRWSVVERSLTDGGFAFYLPFENKTIIHHRTKKKIERRFPLMPGYGFVEGVTNFEALRQCDGVMDVIKSAGAPVPIPATEVRDIAQAEHAVNAEHERKEANRKAREALGTRAALSNAFPVNTTVRVKQGHLLAGESFVVDAATGRATIKGIIGRLNNMSVEIDAVHLEAAE